MTVDPEAGAKRKAYFDELKRLRQHDVVKFDVEKLQYLKNPSGASWTQRGSSWVDSDERMRVEVVYFVQAIIGGPIKIGWTGYYRLKGRLTGLQNGNPERLCVRALVLGGRNVEAALHIEFADLRLEGEWFRNHDRLARIARAVSSDGRDYMEEPESSYSEVAFSGRGHSMHAPYTSQDMDVIQRHSEEEYRAARLAELEAEGCPIPYLSVAPREK
jgi:hypothetical protein